MVAVPDPNDDSDDERRFRIDGVPYAAYAAFRDALDEAHVHVSMTYLDGSLEFMSPSRKHEEEGKLIARMLEAWAEEREVDLRGFKGTTFRSKAVRSGLEPDECYTIGPLEEDGIPHLAIEVVVTRPLLNKLDAYRNLGVREVWVWHSRKRRLDIHALVGEGSYMPSPTSCLLPSLELATLVAHVRAGESHIALVKAFRAALRA